MPSFSLPSVSVHVNIPPAHLFQFPPDPQPSTLPPPVQERHSIAYPFTIPPNVFHGALSVSVPITIALIYATTVSYLNRVNQRRGNKPWAITKTRGWFAFVIFHNVFLAVYSAWTFAGMVKAVGTAWAGLGGQYGLAGAVDSMCKIHGPRGLGDAATFNHTSRSWQFTNRALHFGPDGHTPDSTDVGRIWNEGLAFYGWLFYLSKFYEVIDTAIILAKGKRSSTLQTYHHAGAMMGMWAGIRYMAPPIWMFVLINSFIHSLMYTYFTLTALSYRVPIAIKRTLTTLQIIQFVVGAIFAASHLFVSYDIPVSVPYLFTANNLSSAFPSATNTISSSFVSGMVSANVPSYLKKLAFRAAGAEGMAENVHNADGEAFGIDAVHALRDAKSREEVRYQLTHRTIDCTDTSGEAFAIYLNVIYLLPLTGLFVRFFIKSYLKRSKSGPRALRSGVSVASVEGAGKDAWKGISREVVEAVSEMHGTETPVEEGSLKDDKVTKGEKGTVNDTLDHRLSQSDAKAGQQPGEVASSSDDAIKNEASATEDEKEASSHEANPDEILDEKQKVEEESQSV